MAIRTVAQAAADIRLSADKANADFERIRRDLIAKAQRLEADLAVSIPVTVDQAAITAASAEIGTAFDEFPPVPVSVALNTDAALNDIQALLDLARDVEFRIPVLIDADSATAEIEGLVGTDAILHVPVEVDSDAAVREIEALDVANIEIEATVRPNIANLAGGEFTLPLRADTSRIRSDFAALGPVSLPVIAETDQAVAAVEAIGDQPEPVIVPVIADIDEAAAEIAQVTEPVDVPVTFRESGPGISSGGLARIRADLAEITQPVTVPVTFDEVGPGINPARLARIRADLAEASQLSVVTGITVPIEGDTDPLLGDIAAVSGANAAPVVVPVVSDLDDFALPDTAAPLVVPVESDTTNFRIPGGPDEPPPPPIPVVIVADLTQFNIPFGPGEPPPPPVTVPVDADISPAQARVGAFGSSIGREIEPHAESAGRRAGAAFGRQFSTAASRTLTIAAVTIGGILATSLVEGFQRFTVIEDSTESLTVALQSASEAGQVLSDVLNVVRGTPFRLDDFARAATNMIAFGIEAEKVPRFLTAIGEAAATRGSQANQFAQSLATIFGQIQAIGRINGEDVWQFGNVGVDVLRILGNTLGETTEEIRKMISEGAIPAEFALEAIASGILNGTTGINGATVAFSGVMERLGDTLSGSIENFGAARARFGVAIIDPLSDTLIAGFQSFTKVIDDFTARTRVAFDRLVETPLFDTINEFFEDAPSLIEPTVTALEGLGPALAPLAITFSALGLGALGNVLGPLGALIPGITGLTSAIVLFSGAVAVLSPEIREALIPALVEFGEVGGEVGGTLVRGIGEALEEVSPVVVRAIGVVRDQIPAIRTFLGATLTGLSSVGEAALPIIEKLVTFAEEALPVAFRIATDGVTLLAEVAVAAAPAVEQLVDAGIDLIPTFTTFLDVAEDIGSVLVPVLGAVGEAIGDIPVGVLQTLLGVFLGFRAVSFVQNQVTGVSRALTSVRGQLAQTAVMFNQFRIQGQNSFQALGSAVGTLRGTGSIAVGAGAAIAGAFAGMALASEDAATRIGGAVTAIGTIMTGFATGGIAGGVIGIVATGIGFWAQGIRDAQRETEELNRLIGDLADRIRAEFDGELITPEGLIRREAFQDLFRETLGENAAEVMTVLKDDLDVGFAEIQVAAGKHAEQVTEAIEQGIDPSEITFFDDWVDDLTGQLARIRAQAEDINFSEAINEELRAVDFANVGDADLLALATTLSDAFDLDFDDVIAQIFVTKEAFKELEDVPAVFDAISAGVTAAAVDQDFFKDSIVETGEEVESTGEKAAQELEEWKRRTAETTLSVAELRDMFTEAGAEAETAAEVAQAAWDEFEGVLDSVRSKLDLTVTAQNLDNDLRSIGASLDEVVNMDDLNKVEQINDQIGRVRDRVADLQVNLAETTARADEEAGLLQGRIAKAEAIGAVNAAAELRRQLGEVFDDANKIQRDIDDEFANLNELQSELQGLATEPITLMQQLTSQAAEANLSLFEFLLAAPTEESRAFFQESIVGTVETALSEVDRISAIEGPIAGARAAQAFITEFRTTLEAAGIDPATVDRLIGEVLPNERVEELSREGAEAAASKFFEEVARINAAEPGTLDLRAEITNLQEQQAEIDAFLAENPEITLPVAADTTRMEEQIALLFGRDFQERIDARMAQLEEARKVELAERFGGPAAVQRLFRTKTPEELAREAAQAITDEIERFNSSGENVAEIQTEFEDIESEIRDLQQAIDEQGIVIPVTLNPETLQAQLDEAARTAINENVQGQIRRAIAAQAIGAFGANLFFAEGGITGYAPERHEAHIAHGTRFWAEPETGGEAYLPLSPNKRVSALGVFMKVADIFDLDVHPRDKNDIKIVVPDINMTSPSDQFWMSGDVPLPAVAKLMSALDARSAGSDADVIRKAVTEGVLAARRPLTQEDYERNVIVERIEKLVIGEGESARKRASEFVREMRMRAAKV